MLFQTVCTVSYLPQAFVLARTLKAHIPGTRLCILVTDASPNVISNLRIYYGNMEFIGCDDLDVSTADMRRYYSVLEFCSACKVLALNYQLREKDEPECCFIDPDMLVMGDFTYVIKAADRDILLTYHTLKPYPDDGELPNETEIVATGAINGGFVYMRKSAESLKALDWLIPHAIRDNFVALEYGMCGDQHWLSFLSQFFPEVVGMLRNPRINVAYWNLHERRADRALLFHFSGFAGGSKLSKHSNRKFDGIAELIHTYQHMLSSNTATGIKGDLTFNTQPLRKRMALAEKIHNRKFVKIIRPVERFLLFFKLRGY